VKHVINHIILHKIQADVDGFIATATVTISRLEENELGDTIRVPALRIDVHHKVDDIEAAAAGAISAASRQACEALVRLDGQGAGELMAA
jgi:hypothetical protein